MCGIAAIVSPEPMLAAHALTAMTRFQVHRGPDDEGFEYVPLTADRAGPVLGLGHRRLSIIDLSPLGHQPMVHPQTGDVIVFNGEIYNFQEIRDRLERQGVAFRGHSDTEVLLHGMVRHGTDLLKDLAGMYAFAFFQRAKRRLLLVRDPLGIKPLYVANTPRAWMVASEVRAILASGLVSLESDLRGVAGLLAYGAVQEPYTFFKDISAVPIGSYQWIRLNDDGSVSPEPIERHWKFPAVDRSIDERAAVEGVRREIDVAVRDHLIADVPVGVFLSSGIDSTIVAGLAKRHSPHVRTFTIGFADQPDLAESDLARDTSRALRVEHYDIQMTGDQAEHMTAQWLESLDQPSVDGLNTYVISKAVRDAGVVVALSGLGGDELFGGYPSFLDVPRMYNVARRLSWMSPELRGTIFWALAAMRPQTVRSKVREMGRAGADVHTLYLYRRRAKSDERLRQLGFDARKLGLHPMYIAPEVAAMFMPVDGDPIATVSRLESRFCMGNMLLRDSDSNSMAHSLEIRVPMLDRRVLDLAYRIPGRVRLPDGRPNKHLLRVAFPEFLRPSLLKQRKRGFTLPIRRWMVGPLRPMCEAAIDYLKKSELVASRELDVMWTAFLKNPELQIWSSAFLMCVLGSYLRRCADHVGSAPRREVVRPPLAAAPLRSAGAPSSL